MGPYREPATIHVSVDERAKQDLVRVKGQGGPVMTVTGWMLDADSDAAPTGTRTEASGVSWSASTMRWSACGSSETEATREPRLASVECDLRRERARRIEAESRLLTHHARAGRSWTSAT
jgi:hypothetical protein